MNTDHFKQRLESEKARLEGELAQIARKNPRVAGDWETAPEEPGIEADLIDQADIIVTRENTASILNDLEARYDGILEALARIEKGTYGVCEVGGEKIEEARLEADPAARTCVKHLA